MKLSEIIETLKEVQAKEGNGNIDKIVATVDQLDGLHLRVEYAGSSCKHKCSRPAFNQ